MRFCQKSDARLDNLLSVKQVMAFTKEQREAFSRRGTKALEQLSKNRLDCFRETLNRERRMTSAYIHSQSRAAASSHAKPISNADINSSTIGDAERRPVPRLARELELARRIQKEFSARTRQFCLKLSIFDYYKD